MNTLLRSMSMTIVDAWMAMMPRRRPDRSALKLCKIVSHRGEHNRKDVPENSMRAFEIARAAGVWGIEADIRWTSDLVPVIIHDPDTKRVFAKDITIGNVAFDLLRKELPGVPSLAELVEEFGGNTHLMLELKEEVFPQIERQRQILQRCLSGLKPGQDFHMLALDPALFETFDIQPRNCCLPVAEENFRTLSELTLSSGYGGLTGHFILLNEEIRQRHERAGQQLGTGFIRSRNCGYREIDRGIEWIFSNDAVRLQRAIDKQSL